jgi:KDO2-lipid IV(A) lauroyltransferase
VPTATLTLFAGLARRSDATLLLAFAERLPAGRFRLHLRALPETVRDRDQLVAATALNASIEAAVREFPAQYQWAYRRFKARPPGARPRYR